MRHPFLSEASISSSLQPAPAADPLPVQLPFDGESSKEATRAFATSSPRGVPGLAAPLEEADRALLLAASVALLYRYAQQGEIAIELALAGLEPPTGRLAHFELDAEQSFASLRERAADALAACERARSVLAAAQLTSSSERAAGAFAVSEGARANVGVSFGGALSAELALAAVPASARLGERRELQLVFGLGSERVEVFAIYDAERFRRDTVERLIESFLVLYSAARHDPYAKLYALPVMARAEARAIERMCEGTRSEQSDQLMHLSFERFARTQPEALAARFGAEQISYRELDQRAELLAHYLLASGVRRESTVAVCLAPSLDVLVAVLAIFKAGGVYVPLDPSHPPALLAMILEEAKPQLVLTHEALTGVLPESCPHFCFDRDWEIVDHTPALRPLSPVQLDQTAYVLYTSGTTGRPKGVVASQRNLAHYLSVARERYGFRSDDVFCSLARYTFSISFFELLAPLSSGAQVMLLSRDEVLDPARLTHALGQATVVHAGPSLLGSLFRFLRAGGAGLAQAAQDEAASLRTFPNLRHASSGGDLVSPPLLEEMKRVFPQAEIFVIYGCTEISCMGTTYQVSRTRELRRSFVGRPFTDVVVRVLDAHGNLAPVGAVGEIFFAGKGVARRYLHRPELSSEKFVAIDGQRFYRTGDMGRLHADGNLEILGRRDFQVQLRGIRIELTGIEHTILELGLASQCAVIAAQRDEHDLRLVAFVVNPRERDPGAFRKALAARLPDYMLPQALVVLDALPLTANGKLDRLRLREQAFSAPRERAPSAPVNAAEREVAQAFARVLDVGEVGAEDDFFDLGGHSLSAVLLLSELQNRLGVSVSPGLLFEHTTVRGLAAALSAGTGAEQRPILLSASGEQPALFLLLGVHLYRELARQLEGQYSVYGVYAGSELSLFEAGAQAPTVPELARAYVEIIRRQQPAGPYRLGGMSFGGIVAYEVAQQLERAGEQVESLLLIDSVMPASSLDKLRRLAALPGRELLCELSQRLRSRWVAGPRAHVNPEFVKYGDDRTLSPLEDRRQEAYRAAALDYLREVRPFDGAATLIVAGQRLGRDRLEDPRCGFGGLVSDLTVHTLPADHLALLEAPAVQQLSRLAVREFRRCSGRACIAPAALGQVA